MEKTTKLLIADESQEERRHLRDFLRNEGTRCRHQVVGRTQGYGQVEGSHLRRPYDSSLGLLG